MLPCGNAAPSCPARQRSSLIVIGSSQPEAAVNYRVARLVCCQSEILWPIFQKRTFGKAKLPHGMLRAALGAAERSWCPLPSRSGQPGPNAGPAHRCRLRMPFCSHRKSCKWCHQRFRKLPSRMLNLDKAIQMHLGSVLLLLASISYWEINPISSE